MRSNRKGVAIDLFIALVYRSFIRYIRVNPCPNAVFRFFGSGFSLVDSAAAFTASSVY
jgi:hypothetical protein